MRNLIYAINITLDGCCDHTKQVADDETHEYFTQLMGDVDLLVFGRKTYELMVPLACEAGGSIKPGAQAPGSYVHGLSPASRVRCCFYFRS